MTNDTAILAAICIYTAGCAAIGTVTWLCRHDRRRDADGPPLPCRYSQAHDWP